MQVLSAGQCALVSGGDNPGMGPYAAPITTETRDAFMNAMKPMLDVLPGGGFIESKMWQDFTERMQRENLRNGYDAMGTQYQWPSGTWSPVTSGTASEMGAAMSAASADQLIACIVANGEGASLAEILDACYADVLEDESWDYEYEEWDYN